MERLPLAFLFLLLAACPRSDSSKDDEDGDGYTVDVDCDDQDPDVHPGADETWYDGVDQDCSGGSDYDADGDGHDAATYGGDDCDDEDASVNPDAEETWYDGVDQDCDGASDYDADGDGHEFTDYGGDDCDDGDPDVHPGAGETWYDGVDQDCDGASDYDADGDLFESADYGGTDCDDGNPYVHPGAVETWYDGVDQDCDGASDYDADGDGHDAEAYGGDDCDDADASVNPDADEVCNDVDDDCDGIVDDDAVVLLQWYEDADGDGYGAGKPYEGCDGPSGYVLEGGDCDDADPDINPGATELCDPLDVDEDCDGLVDDDDPDVEGQVEQWPDADGDGYGDESATCTLSCDPIPGYVTEATDCDDTDAEVHPGAVEDEDGVDDDCDGTVDDLDLDGDGWSEEDGDCDDEDPDANPGAEEIADNGVDDDCDGCVDYIGPGEGTVVSEWAYAYGYSDSSIGSSALFPWLVGEISACGEDFDGTLTLSFLDSSYTEVCSIELEFTLSQDSAALDYETFGSVGWGNEATIVFDDCYGLSGDVQLYLAALDTTTAYGLHAAAYKTDPVEELLYGEKIAADLGVDPPEWFLHGTIFSALGYDEEVYPLGYLFEGYVP